MRKYFSFFLIILLVLPLMVLPVMAYSSYVFVPDDLNSGNFVLDSRLPEGSYIVSLMVDGMIIGNSDPIDFIYGDISDFVNLGSFLGSYYDLTIFFPEIDNNYITFSLVVGGSGDDSTYLTIVDVLDASFETELSGISICFEPIHFAPSEIFVQSVSAFLTGVVGWFGLLVNAILSPDGALAALFPFVAIGFSFGLIWGVLYLIKKFVPGF